MVVLGETVTDAPIKLPGIQEYVVAPLAVIVVLAPIQIFAAVVVVEITGNGFTVIVIVAVFTQPTALVPVTV